MRDPAGLLVAGVRVPDILEAVRRTNLIDSPGLLEENHQLVLGLINGQVRSPGQIAGIVIKATPAGVPIHVGDVATVTSAVKPVYTIVTANGKPSLLININRQPDSNTVQVADEVHAEIERIQKTLPRGIQLQPFSDHSPLLHHSIPSSRDPLFISSSLPQLLLSV